MKGLMLTRIILDSK